MKPDYDTVNVICEICGETYQDYPSAVDTTSYNCCSLECEAASWKLPKREPKKPIGK